MKQESYHVLIDLEKGCKISQKNLNDMHNKQDLSIEYGEISKWTIFFIDPCDSFKKWNTNRTPFSLGIYDSHCIKM